MMFKPTQNIDSAFRTLRAVMMIAICGSICVCLYAIYKYGDVTAVAQDRMYIVAGSKAVQVFASSRKDNIPIEARDHVNTFHQYFFSLDPDDKAISASIAKALYLSDATAKRQYDDLREKGFYEGIVSGNISQEIVTDSIAVDISVEPYHFLFYGTLKIIRPTSVLTRNLITKGRLRNVSRTENNPHGFLIERWEILENRDLHVEAR